MQKDEKWKILISKYLKDFLSFFMAELNEQIDFDKGYEFLDGELNRIKIKSKSRNRRSDKLVKVYLKDGTEQYLLIHIEIQGYSEDDFSERMFTYYYRISDLHRTRNITAISVYTEDNQTFKPNSFENKVFGTEITYKYNTYKVLEQNQEILKKSNNIFAFLVLAVLYSLRAKDNQKKKLKFKIELTKILVERNYSQDEITELFEFINLFLSFGSEKYDNLFYEELEKMPKVKEKEVLNSFEKFMMKKLQSKIEDMTRELQSQVEDMTKKLQSQVEDKSKQKSKEIAKNFKELGVELEKISKATGLTKEEIENL